MVLRCMLSLLTYVHWLCATVLYFIWCESVQDPSHQLYKTAFVLCWRIYTQRHSDARVWVCISMNECACVRVGCEENQNSCFIDVYAYVYMLTVYSRKGPPNWTCSKSSNGYTYFLMVSFAFHYHIERLGWCSCCCRYFSFVRTFFPFSAVFTLRASGMVKNELTFYNEMYLSILFVPSANTAKKNSSNSSVLFSVNSSTYSTSIGWGLHSTSVEINE